MRAGKLTETITIQRFTSKVDEMGTPVLTWRDLAKVRAEVIESGTKTYIRAYGASDETLMLFRIRWLSDIKNADRVLYKGKEMKIKGITDIQRKRGLEITARAS